MLMPDNLEVAATLELGQQSESRIHPAQSGKFDMGQVIPSNPYL